MLGRRKIRCTPVQWRMGTAAIGVTRRVRCPLAKYGILHCFFFSCGPMARLLAYWTLLVATTSRWIVCSWLRSLAYYCSQVKGKVGLANRRARCCLYTCTHDGRTNRTRCPDPARRIR